MGPNQSGRGYKIEMDKQNEIKALEQIIKTQEVKIRDLEAEIKIQKRYKDMAYGHINRIRSELAGVQFDQHI